MFFTKVNEPSFQVVWPCKFAQVMFEDSKGAYATPQPSTDSLKESKRLPVLSRGKKEF